ncbi:MAG: acyl-CoA dehydrogenase family protein [Thermomicrobiales bacterium]|nr:acyl-CoA dehydrogenase family protein [Thermomicrobiales bacterium]
MRGNRCHTQDRRYRTTSLQFGPQCIEAHPEPCFAPRAAAHDQVNAFAAENFQEMRDSGYLRLAVPRELGGLGASMRQVCYAQAELAKHCAATALAVNMHHYLVLANVARWRHGAPVEGMLRAIATDARKRVALRRSSRTPHVQGPSAAWLREMHGHHGATLRYCSVLWRSTGPPAQPAPGSRPGSTTHRGDEASKIT